MGSFFNCPLCRVYVHDHVEASLAQGFRTTYTRARALLPQFVAELCSDFAACFHDDWLADCIAYRCKQIEKKRGRTKAIEYCIVKQKRLRDAFELWGVALYEAGVASEQVLAGWISAILYDLFLILPHFHRPHEGAAVLPLLDVEWDEEHGLVLRV
jgi:hypothetical protein